MNNKSQAECFIQKFGQRANFAYEVVSQIGETSKMTWEENGIQYSSLKSDYIFKSLGDCESLCDKFLCSLYDEDAEKSLRPGEMISAKLKFDVRINNDGIYEQSITASDVLTLNDYHNIREAMAAQESESTSAA